MPGPISDAYRGPPEDGPYVPSWCYPKGAKMCPCKHHEGFHADDGTCVRRAQCGCAGMPRDCLTSNQDMG